MTFLFFSLLPPSSPSPPLQRLQWAFICFKYKLKVLKQTKNPIGFLERFIFLTLSIDHSLKSYILKITF